MWGSAGTATGENLQTWAETAVLRGQTSAGTDVLKRCQTSAGAGVLDRGQTSAGTAVFDD